MEKRRIIRRRSVLIGMIVGGFGFWPIVFLFASGWRESLNQVVGTGIVMVLYLIGLGVYSMLKRCPACPHKLDDHEGFLFGDRSCNRYSCDCPGAAHVPIVPKAKAQ